MENALGVDRIEYIRTHDMVSILVVMENALGDDISKDDLHSKYGSLNPCCNGKCSWRAVVIAEIEKRIKGLNPCCNGKCSWSIGHQSITNPKEWESQSLL